MQPPGMGCPRDRRSPTGSTTAALLAQTGRNVVVLEKDRLPRFHIGESLLPLNLPLFERLGVADEIRRIGVYKPGAKMVSDAHGIAMKFSSASNPCLPVILAPLGLRLTAAGGRGPPATMMLCDTGA
jgi:2-polyprenyl-6-methoxyphenol hydroxylase-like FAD-dependent oxidoreductase